MQTTSAVASVLLTLKSGFDSVTDVPVYFGPQRDTERECVWIGDVTTPGEQQWALLGAEQREERFAANVTVLASSPQYQTPDAQITRAFQIFGLLETWLRSNVDLGLSATFRHLRAEVARVGVQQYPHADDGHPTVQVDFAVAVVARI